MTAITSSTTTAPITATTNQHQPRKEEYTIASVVLKFFEEKAKDVAKALGYTAFWAGEAVPNLPPQVKTFSTTMGDFKNFISATEVPGKAVKAWESVKNLWNKATEENMCSKFYESCKANGISGAIMEKKSIGEAARNAFKDTAFLINSTIDGIDFSHRFVHIDQTAMNWLKGANFAATLGSSGLGAAEEIHKLTNAEETQTHKRNLAMINLAKNVSYAALGAIGLYFMLTATAFVPWMFVACLTAGLSFTIGGYFYEKIYDPENKGKNLNPEIVIENAMARRARA